MNNITHMRIGILRLTCISHPSTASSQLFSLSALTNTLKDTLIDGGYLKGIDTNRGDARFVPLVDSPFYLQTFVHEEDENYNAPATLKTERMEDDVAKGLHKRVWGDFLKYTEEYKKTLGEGEDGSFGHAAKKYKEEKLTSDLDGQFLDLVMAASEVDYTGGRDELSIFGDTIDEDNSKMIHLQFLLSSSNPTITFISNHSQVDSIIRAFLVLDMAILRRNLQLRLLTKFI